ncbi:MAG: hypothetical protein V1874_07375 [Spirochaetota bacterium]
MRIILTKLIISILAAILFSSFFACGGGGGDSESSDKAITAFAITSPAATGSIDENAKTIAVTVPYVPSVTDLVATFTTTGSSVQVGLTIQVSGATANDFTYPVVYTITAEDNSTANYTVTVTVECTVIYNGNGNTNGTVPIASAGYNQGSTVTVALNTGNLLKINTGGVSYKFDGWNTQADGSGTDYAAGSGTFIINANITLYVKWTPFALRDVGPAGGLIFYDKGSYSDSWRYMEAAPGDQQSKNWGTYDYTVPGADGTAIGTGKQNTLDIIAGDAAADKAADECANYSIVNSGVTFDDWFLPSYDEVDQMYLNLKSQGIGGFDAGQYYWSSSEYGVISAWVKWFGNGAPAHCTKAGPACCVRAVRSF